MKLIFERTFPRGEGHHKLRQNLGIIQFVRSIYIHTHKTLSLSTFPIS